MALIQCPECQKQISEQAAACPHCGFPLREAARAGRWNMNLLDPLAELAGFVEEMAATLRRSLRPEEEGKGEGKGPAEPPPDGPAEEKKENE